MNNNIKITYPNSDKVYLNGNLYPELRVAMRRVRLTPTVTVENEKRKLETNAPIYIYDTSGPNFCAARISHSLKECKEQ
ncbi:MAG: hypothetical protein J6Q93_01500 [Prevotella sp.]|nr:hypothetical protein [Prevotella sp.]